ncbi:MAG: glycosyltransferase [Actinomycetota bacterium]
MTLLPLDSESVLVPIKVERDTHGGATALLDWFRRRRVDLAILAVLLLVAAMFHANGMDHNPARGDDEGTYVAQAWAVNQGELAHYTYWYDHPPVGWIQLAAYDRVTGAFADSDTAVAGGREAMLVVKLATMVALYVLARRLRLSPVSAGLAVALFSLSPLAITFQRAVWLDNIAVLWLAISLALVSDRRGRMGPVVLASVCFAIAVLTKETTLLVAPFLGWLAWRHLPAPTRLMAAVVATTTSAIVVLGYPLLAILRGELIPGDGHVSLLGAVHWQLVARESSGNIFDTGTEANRVLMDWFNADPGLVLLGSLAVIPALLIPRVRPLAACLAFHLVLPLRGGYLPVPYIIVLIPLLALCLAAVVDAAFRRIDLDELRAVGRWIRHRLVNANPLMGPPAPGVKHAAYGIEAVAAVGLALVLAFVIVPHWSATHVDGDLRSAAPDAGITGAQDWLEANVDPTASVVVEDTIWLDLVHAGFEPDKVIWFFKVDLDPAVKAGPDNVDYVVLHNYLAEEARPILADILDHSEIVATFGQGIGEVSVWRVQR